MGVALGLALTLRCARFAGLSDDAIGLIAGGQLEALLAGAEPFDGGPPAGPLPTRSSLAEQRVAALLNAAGGALIGGGDPARPLELAACAVAGSVDDRVGVDAGSVGSIDPRLGSLIETAAAGSDESVGALVLALGLASAPGVEVGVAMA
jgi:hypothetical protein